MELILCVTQQHRRKSGTTEVPGTGIVPILWQHFTSEGLHWHHFHAVTALRHARSITPWSGITPERSALLPGRWIPHPRHCGRNGMPLKPGRKVTEGRPAGSKHRRSHSKGKYLFIPFRCSPARKLRLTGTPSGSPYTRENQSSTSIQLWRTTQ